MSQAGILYQVTWRHLKEIRNITNGCDLGEEGDTPACYKMDFNLHIVRELQAQSTFGRLKLLAGCLFIKTSQAV